MLSRDWLPQSAASSKASGTSMSWRQAEERLFPSVCTSIIDMAFLLTFSGVCVSGGPDSMALAFLLKQLSLRSDDIMTRPVAFIVNHNARKESSEEAQYVGFQLRNLGGKRRPFSRHFAHD
jgi:hypothetical protein